MYHMSDCNGVIVEGPESTGNVPEILDYDDTVEIRIGRYCCFASGVKILKGGNLHTEWVSTSSIFYKDSEMFPNFMKLERPRSRKHGDVIVEDDVWIGYGVTLLPDAHIHTGAVVGGVV